MEEEMTGVAVIDLPVSKSIANRLMVMCGLAGAVLPSPPAKGGCADLEDMYRAMQEGMRSGECRVRESGTALRLLTAFFAVCAPGRRFFIRCSGRLAERPLDPLLGYLEELGMPPAVVEKDASGEKSVTIFSGRLKGGSLRIGEAPTSQYVTALLLAAPCMERGLELRLSSGQSSLPYVDMTVRMMRRHGIEVLSETTSAGIRLEVKPAAYRISSDTVCEADWSAAAFFFEYVAVHGGKVLLRGLPAPDASIQGDARCAELFRPLGVTCLPVEGGILIEKKQASDGGIMEACMCGVPDLVPAFVAACCLCGRRFSLQVPQSLRVKESDRIEAVERMMRAFGYRIEEKGGALVWNGERCTGNGGAAVEDASDHRIAMAIYAAGGKPAHPECVSKSFPDFYRQIHELMK